MDMLALMEFFKWCSIINFGMLMVTFGVVMLLKVPISKIHIKVFGLSELSFNIAIYSFFGVYKLLWLMFCLVPYIALRIMA